MRQLYEGLYRSDEEGTLPALASFMSLSEDGLTYTFTLREASWSDGTPITAFDFERCWTEVLENTLSCNYAALFQTISTVQAPSSKTLMVTLNRPTPYFLELTAFPTFYPYKEGCYSGPFSLVSWEPSDKMVLRKNENYWDKTNVALDGIELSLIDDSGTESYLFEKGELDWLGRPISNSLPFELLEVWREQGKLLSYDLVGTFWLVANTEKSPFNNCNIRKAMSLAIDREGLITHVLGGGRKVAKTILPPSLTFFPDQQDHSSTLLANHFFERGLLEEGWTHETLPPITLTYPSSQPTVKIAQCIAEQWQKTFGFEIALQAIEPSTYYALAKRGEFQIGTGEWIADFVDPTAFLDLFKEKNLNGVGRNNSNWTNENYTALLEAADLEKDLSLRTAMLKQAEAILMEELPIIPLYHHAFDYVKKDAIQGVVLSPLGTSDFKRATLR